MSRERVEWRKVKVGENHFVMARPLDPKILEQMPPAGSKTFIEVGPVELIIHDIKKALHPDETISY
jgi:hypothetical protein